MPTDASPIGSLFVRVGADVKSFDEGLSHVSRSLQSTAQSTEQHTGRMSGAFGAVGAAVSGLAGGLGKLGLAGMGLQTAFGAVQGLGDMLGVGAASDVAESANKIDVVFGEAGASVKAFAETTAASLGQSKGQALEAAGTFGNLFYSMGLGKRASADMSVDLVKLASDLASFNNLDPGEVLEKLRSGLVGEAEPMRALGVLLNEETVSAKGLAMGLGDANGKLSEAAKVQARYALILQQTTAAQGDFARTSTGMANAQRIISASMEDLKVQIGEGLLPTIAPLISGVAQALPDAFRAARPVIRAFGSTVEGMIDIFRRAGGVVRDFLGYLDPGNQRDLMREWFGDFGPRIDEFVRGLKRAGEVAGFFLGYIREGDWGMLREMVSEYFGSFDIQPLYDALGRAGETIKSTLDAIPDAVRGTVAALGAAWEGLAPTTERISKVFEAVRGAVISLVPEPLQSLVKSIGDTSASVTAGLDPLTAIVNGINALSAAAEGATRFISEHKEVQAILVGVVAASATAWTAATAAALAHTAVTKGVAIVTEAYTAVQWALNAALTANPIGIVVVALAGLAAGLVYAYQTSEDFRTTVDTAFVAVQEVVSTAMTVGKQVLDAFGVGMQDAIVWAQDFQAAIATAMGIASQAIDAFSVGVQNAIAWAQEAITWVQNVLTWIQNLSNAIAGLPAPLANALGLGGIALLAPPDKRATGGPVSANSAYLVGERGPELFVPRSAGSITAGDQLRGVHNWNITINAPGGDPVAVRDAARLGVLQATRALGITQ